MDKMERIIIGHRSEFDVTSVPSGSKARFMAMVNERKRIRKNKVFAMTLAGMAAACAAIMISLSYHDVSLELHRHHTRLAEKEIQIIELAERDFPEEMEMIIGTARSITGDTIALEDLLPEEISERERCRILREYYNTKISALDRLMAQYTE